MTYDEFIKAKVVIAHDDGLQIEPGDINPMLKEHQKLIVQWMVRGGRRACFASFGLGKTMIQLEAVRLAREAAQPAAPAVQVVLRQPNLFAPAPAVPEGEIVITKDEDGVIISVTRQNEEGRIISVLGESAAPAVPCEHRRAKYDITFTQGTCQDCGAKWTASQGWSAAPAVPLTDDMVEAEFVSRGDDKGQGLHPYWKDAFREGFNFARSQLSAAPAAPVPLTDDQIDEIWDGSFDSADPKRQLSFRQIITRAIEAHHGIGGSNG